MHTTEQKIIQFIKENHLIAIDDKILVAFSGGPDSIFLLNFLYKYIRKYKIKISAVHVNHQLRGQDSEDDENFCKDVCSDLGVPFYSHKKDVKTYSQINKCSLEVAGRKIRYECFEETAASIGYNKIATAHNADDNAETVLLNLIKGAGPKGISGIPIKREEIIRPVMVINKQEILDYLKENNIKYRIDESNLSNEFERNYLRNEIIPLITKNLNPSFAKTVLQTALNFQRLNSLIDKLISNLRSEIKVEKNKIVSIPIPVINKQDDFITSQLIKDVVEENFSVKLESKHLAKITSLKNRQAGKSEELTANLICFKDRQEIKIFKSPAIKRKEEKFIKIGETVTLGKHTLSIEKVTKESIRIDSSSTIEYISGDSIKRDFTIRNWYEGDKFYPIGMHGTKKISDYLNDIKVDTLEKKEQLVLENNGKIVWIIKRRLDDRFKITPNTKRILKLCLR
jgi:tRNA(Ile)-lysidine synthase